MSCQSCGAAMSGSARFCSSCGAPSPGLAAESATHLGPVDRPSAVAGRAPAGSGAGSPGSGWLSSSDSISHGRFAPGNLFDARYRIIGLLGRGGMGEVYRADDLRLGQQVALKFLPVHLRNDPVRLAQFHNEVRTARQVSHPNVCRVYDIGEADGLLYLSMEYVDGEDLATSLRRIGRFPEDRAIDLARQLCAGLAAAHQRGVIHRDLKPANVMLDGAGHVRVMDFGLAAVGLVDDIRAGTPAYMAPEQLLGREVTVRSDIFALGLVLYELFTGRRAFTAATIGDLVAQHEAGALTPPSAIVTSLEPGVERAIRRCLESEPDRRPATALAVAASLPGGDPLAMALAAGETPSPEMVAAAGEGAGLTPRVVWPLFIAVVAGTAASFVLALSTSPLEMMHPEYTAEVLAQKARDAASQLGDAARGDEAYGFRWNTNLMEYLRDNDKPSPRWKELLSQRPSPLEFWYRRSQDPLTAFAFHSDLLTPGIVEAHDPPPTVSGMAEIDLDHQGRLLYFERMSPQRQDAPVSAAEVDWSPLFALAGLDRTKFQSTEPLWNWLAATDTRAAWTGAWPESGRPLRIEAAGFGGHPVGFMLAGPWQKPWRSPSTSSDDDETMPMIILIVLAIGILTAAALVARRNLRQGRGDLAGAARLAAPMSSILMLLWLCQVHLVASVGLFAMFFVAVCTSVFYGVLLWTLYVALEPFVRKHWPQVLVSWTSVLTGRARDSVVGRDLLIGVALGVTWVVIIRGVDRLTGGEGIIGFPGSTELLLGLRSTAGVVLQAAPYAIRNVFLYFFLLFLLRVLLRRQGLAAVAFAVVFAALSAVGNDRPFVGALMSFIYFGSGAFVVLRWGLLSFAVGAFVSTLLMVIPATVDTSAWYFGNMLVPLLAVLGLASWGLYASLGERIGRPGPAVN